MLPLLLALTLSAEPSPPPKLQLAAPGLATVGIDEKLGDFFGEHLAQQLKLAGANVVTRREISTLLGQERQQQLLGCVTEGTSCLAELAAGLGVDATLIGDLARVGSRYQVNLKIISSANGATVALFSESTTSEDGTLDALTRAAATLSEQAASALRRRLDPKTPPGPNLRQASLIPAIVGVVLAGGGAGLLIASNADYEYVTSGREPDLTAANRIVDRGSVMQVAGVVALAAGGVSLAVAAGLFAFGAPVTPVVAPVKDGAVVGFVGVLP